MPDCANVSLIQIAAFRALRPATSLPCRDICGWTYGRVSLAWPLRTCVCCSLVEYFAHLAPWHDVIWWRLVWKVCLLRPTVFTLRGSRIHNQMHTFIIGKTIFVKKMACVGVGPCGGAQCYLLSFGHCLLCFREGQYVRIDQTDFSSMWPQRWSFRASMRFEFYVHIVFMSFQIVDRFPTSTKSNLNAFGLQTRAK